MVMTDSLFEEYKGLVLHCYRRLYKTKFVIDNAEDIIQEGYLALINAINTFEEQFTIKLSTYVFHCIKYNMWKYIQKNSKPYSITDVDISDPINADLTSIEEDYCNIYEEMHHIIEDYEYYLKNYKSKNVNIEKRLFRAHVILTEYINNGHKTSTREIEEKYCIGRTLVSQTIHDLRNMMTLKINDKLYKENK